MSTAAPRASSGPAGDPSRAAVAPVRAAFIALGVFWGTWAVSVADVQQAFGLSDATLGLLLAASVAIAGLTSAVVGHRAERWGTGRLLAGSLGFWSVLLVGAGLAPSWTTFAIFFGAAEVAGGCVDTAMNAAASQRLLGRPGALVRFHALFNLGALSGAAVAGVVLHFGVSWRWLWPSLAVLVAILALWTALTSQHRGTPESTGAAGAAVGTGTPGTPGPGGVGPLEPLRRLRADGLIILLVIFAIAEITEGGIDTWGVLFLRTHLAAGVLLGAGAYVIGQSVAAATRGFGGPTLGRLSARIALVVGGTAAAIGILIESLSPVAVVAACGLALGAAGASLFWPLVMSQATAQASRATATVGAFTAAGYVGWVAGAPIVGWVSDTWGPARGLQVLALFAACVVVGALLLRDRPLRSATGTERSASAAAAARRSGDDADSGMIGADR